MRTLRRRCLALPEPYQAQALDMWKQAHRTLGRYPNSKTAENQVKFDLATELKSFEYQVAKDNEEV